MLHVLIGSEIENRCIELFLTFKKAVSSFLCTRYRKIIRKTERKLSKEKQKDNYEIITNTNLNIQLQKIKFNNQLSERTKSVHFICLV